MPEQLTRLLKSNIFWSTVTSVAFNVLMLDITEQGGVVTISAVGTGAVVFSFCGELAVDGVREFKAWRASE